MSDEVTICTYSDDNAHIEGRDNIDESEFWGFWWPLMVDGVKVGEVKVDYEGPWVFKLRGVDGHVVDIDDDESLLPQEFDEWGDRIWPDA
jgi:hypothetical protein